MVSMMVETETDKRIVEVLLEIKKNYGESIFEDKRRMNSILRDMLIGEVRYEQCEGRINVLNYALDKRIHEKLAQNRENPIKTQEFYIKELKINYNDEAAFFVINALSVVIGIKPVSAPNKNVLEENEENNITSSNRLLKNNAFDPQGQSIEVLAKKGDPEAQNELGKKYEKGRGVPLNYAEAVKWYRLAAEQGNANGQNNLGVMYDNGRGVPLNYAEAVKWFRLAAEQGDLDGQRNLGVMYENGRGVPLNYAEAVKWYRLAAEQGNDLAKKDLMRIRVGTK